MNKALAQPQPVPFAARAMRKVPEIIVYFWIVKVLTTAMGEATSDYLVYNINHYVAVALGGLGLVAALALQLWARRYVAWIYWLAVTMVAIFGTMAADILHIVIGVPYVMSTAFFAVVLAVVFVVWYRSEKTLSIHSIYAGRREFFYWATVMATFALGTAAGDWTAASLRMGYFASGVLFGILFALPGLALLLFGLDVVAAFWFAYIMTRPFGASFADWFGKSILGGLGLGDTRVSLVLTVLIVGFVGYLTATRLDVKVEDGGRYLKQDL
jgi:uncharacterized membrane-anchored protein